MAYKKTHILWITFCLILAICTGISMAQEQQPAKVRVDQVHMEMLQEHRQVTGNLRAISRSEVASIEQGKVIEVEVDEAEHVKEGDVLARLDDKRLRIQHNELQAQLQSTRDMIQAHQAELDNSEWNYNRLKPLWDKQMTTEQNLRDAERDYIVRKAELNSTRSNLEQIQHQIELLNVRINDKVVRAPFDGWVVNRQIEVGEWINPGDPVVTLVSSGRVEAWLEVPERFKEPVHQYAKELQVNLFEGKKSVISLNSRIIPEVDPRVRTFMLVADLDTQEGLLVPGMSVTAWIPTGTRAEFKTIPVDAMLRDQAGFYVIKAQSMPEGGYMASPVSIEVLFDHEDRVVVESRQLMEGDYVVIEGNERLRPMTPIEFIEENVSQNVKQNMKQTVPEKKVSSG